MPIVGFARWDPLRDLLAIQQRLSPGPTGWAPPVDVYETADEYVLTAEIPGVLREDIVINVANGELQLSGERREQGGCCEQHLRLERGRGRFSRTFQLPLPVEHERITADLRDGVLTVICPKATERGTRRIQVS